MSASEPNRSELPPHTPSREELAVAPTQALRPDESSSQLVSLLDEYLAELQAGRQPDRVKLLAEHPELAAQLEQCLSGIEFIHRASAPAAKSGMPTHLGDFRIVREVGRGGMGVVYEAEQISLKRRVALKVLRFGAAADIEAMQRFQREAETVATLHHTNIVPIFAIGCEGGVNYYAMQFIEGQSLANVGESLRDSHSGHGVTGLLCGDVANWGLQAAEALAHAHQRGVIHRDIKPSNLILDPDGRIWLTDFGLAKRIDDVSLSMAGAILGTPRYMSPEQAAASKNPVDHRTDIYSLGATLYELATGRPLFEGDSPHAVITQILTTEPPAPRVICPNLPRDFETIIVKCLAKEPNRRYATAQALADDLRAFVEGRAIRARRSTLAEQAARWFKQQKRSVGVAAAAVAATIAVVIGSLIAWQMHGQSRLGYLTLNTPRDGDQRAEVAEVLTLDDKPVGAPFTLPTKEPLALTEGAYRLRLTAPSKVSQTYLFDIAAGAQLTQDVGLVNETVGYAISLRSPVGVEVVQSSRHVPRDESRTSTGAVRANDAQATKNADSASGFPHAEREGYVEPRLFVGPQDSSKPTLRCYAANSQPGWKPDGTRETEVAPLWEANWSLESPAVIALLKLPEDREAWKVFPAQTDVLAWQQVLSWFDPWWFRNGSSPKIMQPMRDLNGDGVEDVIWCAPQVARPELGTLGPGPGTPKAAVLVAASGKDGRPLWWFRSQGSDGGSSVLRGTPIWSGDALVCVMRSAVRDEMWIEAVSPQTGSSLWRHGPLTPSAPGTPVTIRTTHGSELHDPTTRLTEATLDGQPVVIAIIGNQLLMLDSATGEPRRSAQALPSYAYAARFVDLDADGFPEALLTFMDQQGSPQVMAFSVTRLQPLWDTSILIEPYRYQQIFREAAWPLVVDLDDDGRNEVVLPNNGESGARAWVGCRVLDGATGKLRWERRFPIRKSYGEDLRRPPEQYAVGPDLDGDGQRELFTVSVRREYQMQVVHQSVGYQREQYFLYVDCFSGRDGKSLWLQRLPFGTSEYSTWTGTPEAPIWWEGDVTRSVSEGHTRDSLADASGYIAQRGYLVLPVRRHADQGGDGIGNAGARLLFVLSAETGRVEHTAEQLALPRLVDWNNDGLDDLAVFVPDDPHRFANANISPDLPAGKFVVLRGSPPEAFRRLDRWVEEQDFDGDGIAELSQRYHGHGDYAINVASGRDGHIMSHWQVNWPETPRSFTVGELQSFPLPLGDFDGDGLADLLVSREANSSEFDSPLVTAGGTTPLLLQAISGKTGKRLWGGSPIPTPAGILPQPIAVDSKSPSYRQTHLKVGFVTPLDLDGDDRPEVLVELVEMDLIYHRMPTPQDSSQEHRQQQLLAALDGRTGALRWCEPYSDVVVGESYSMHSGSRVQRDHSADLNGDGTRDIVLTVPHKDQQGSWSQTLQAHSGRDGKKLWGPKPLEGTSFNDNEPGSLIVSDLDGDGRVEIVRMEAKQPRVTVLRGDTGESLWTWQGSQPQYFAAPSIAVVAQSSRHAPRDESRTSTDAHPAKDAQTTTNANSALGKSFRGAKGLRRCVAVAFNETGSRWDVAFLDHEGKLLERVPNQAYQLWSHDLDGDGGEELLSGVGSKIQATRGLHDMLWSWSPPQGAYAAVSHFERTADGRLLVYLSSGDSLLMLDGLTGKPLRRTWASTNTRMNENGRELDLNRPKLNSKDESPRLLTRVGDGTVLLTHVVSRAVLPTDEDGRYQRSHHAPRDEPNALTTLNAGSKSADKSESLARSARHAERDGYVDDPRLIQQLPWVPSASEWSSSFWIMLLMQLARAILLSLVIVLIPFWLIRAGMRRRELGWWRGVLIVAGVTVVALSIVALRSLTSSPGMAGLPWGPQLAMAFGALPILTWPAAVMSSVLRNEWRRLKWLLGGSLFAAVALAVILLVNEFGTMLPEQHYSWHGWWFILFFGAFAVGAVLFLKQVFGPGLLWLWKFGRRRFARHV